MKKLFASKELKKAIRKTMTKTQRRQLDDGAMFFVTIKRNGKVLHRWGYDDDSEMINVATVIIQGKACLIHETNLEQRSWDWDLCRAFKEAVDALDYYVYGEKKEYSIKIKEYK